MQLLDIERRSDINAAVAVGQPGSGAARRVFIETYGCQMNVSDTELMMGVLKKAGFRRALALEDADVVLLNTCAIRERAEERVAGRLSQLSRVKRARPDLVLGVSGCMAKHLAEQLLDRLPYVDLVVGPDSYRRLPELIGEAAGNPALDVRLDRGEDYLELDPVRQEGTNAWITIMRGCDKFCTFCIVPYVRGRERSVPAGDLLRQVRLAASEGFQEVTLLGQTVNSYHDGESDFADLLKMVARVEGIRRIRFTSPHPSDFSDKLIGTIAEESKICRFIHLPVQSGSDRVLEAMKRTYSSGRYVDLVDRLRSAVPGLCLSTDVIVGFPGEDDSDFESTMALMRHVRYDSAFMFKYSPRKGTVAYREIPDTVPETEKSRRLQAVIAQQTGISGEINRRYVGRMQEVLVEGDARRGKGQAVGKSDGFKTVVFPRDGIRTNTFVDIRITDATSHTLIGRPEN
ncbi:MAG: tRNA (N6-isopentenyl adenosine(37)-C2)-methylthiotransferase MiaB [Gemmatimonadetes bacterium]|nr:tRNA (N6-isopentenyl adenosine(37)-C2)-methylthiotransferase MiaB [Gemmatimonadota bacterium]